MTTNIEWDENEFPLAYLITIRTHGTWLHGDQRKSVDRHNANRYGSERIQPDPLFSVIMDRNMSAQPFLLDGAQRAQLEIAIRNFCRFRGYGLFAANVRTNNGHAVIAAQASPERVVNGLKANATRELREAGLVRSDQKVWSRRGSARYLWKSTNVNAAIDYVLYGQGDDLPDF